MEGTLSSDGLFSGRVQQVYEGDVAVSLRAAFRQVPESQWKESVQRISYNLNFGGEVSNVKVSPPDDIDKPFRISYYYVRKDYADWSSHHTSPALPPMGVEARNGVREKKPEEPVLLGSLGKVEYQSRILLPDGYRVLAPPNCDLVESFAEYHASTHIEGGVMTTVRELDIKKTEVPLSEWENFRKFGTAVADDEFNMLNVEGSDAAASKKNASGKEAGVVAEKEPEAQPRKNSILPNWTASFAMATTPSSSATFSGRKNCLRRLWPRIPSIRALILISGSHWRRIAIIPAP